MIFSHTILAKLTRSIAGLLCLAQVGCACRPATDSASAPVAAPSETDEEKSGTASGEKVARELIALGQIQLRFEWGSLTGVTALLETTPGLAEHLRTTLKIDCRELGFAPRNAYERAYSASFNRTMVAHLETLHGKGFIFKAEEEAAYQQGKAAATRELAEGKLALETYGLPPVSRRAYMDLLKQRHGIQLRAVAGCIVNSTITGHARGFNEVMMAEIEKRFGPDALTKLIEEAEKITRNTIE